jgi:acetyl coenzyme A synthetase (ADP forming)-like protein
LSRRRCWCHCGGQKSDGDNLVHDFLDCLLGVAVADSMKPDQTLRAFFAPRAVAVVGASRDPDKVGYRVLENLLRGGFGGAIYPVNPAAKEVLGLTVYPSLSEIGAPVDLAVVVLPAPRVLGAIEACAAQGIGAAIVISAGFKEVGGEGAELEEALKRRVRQLGIRVLGPNCLGLVVTEAKLNATFAKGMPPPGGIAFVSQSGALCTAALDWAVGLGIGFSALVSLGNKADLSEAEIIEVLADDPKTRVIVGYVEAVEDGQGFLSVAKAASGKKPVVFFKAGTTEGGARAAASHTGALAGADRAYEAAFKQAGVIRARSLRQLFDFARVFSSLPLPGGNRIAIVTNAGGPGIIAADACEGGALRLAVLAEPTLARLRRVLPASASLHNPVDVIGDASADRYQAALEAVASDPGVDGLLALATPQAMTDMEKFAQAVVEVGRGAAKPVLAAFMAEASLLEANKILLRGGIPDFPFPDEAVKALEAMARYEAGRDRPPLPVRFPADRAGVAKLLQKARDRRVPALGESDAREVLIPYGFRGPKTVLASNASEAADAADQIGYPVVLKIVAPEILHKSEVSGVRLGLLNREAVREAYAQMVARAASVTPHAHIEGVLVQSQMMGGREVILGAARDRQFGPLLMFGLGGIYVEVLKDVTFRIAPLCRAEAEAMVREVRAFPLLQGVRGEPPADLAALVEDILRLSQLVTDFAEIAEIDINPLLVMPKGEGTMALDARIRLVSSDEAAPVTA